MSDLSIHERLEREVLRLGLNPRECPTNLAGTEEGINDFIATLRGMEPGVTWRDVLPDLPEDSYSANDEIEIEPFKSFGSFDYQSPPAGAAVMVAYPATGFAEEFNALVEAAKIDGFEIYGAQYFPPPGKDMSGWGIIVMTLGTNQDRMWRLIEWLHEQPSVFAAMPKRLEGDYT